MMMDPFREGTVECERGCAGAENAEVFEGRKVQPVLVCEGTPV